MAPNIDSGSDSESSEEDDGNGGSSDEYMIGDDLFTSRSIKGNSTRSGTQGRRKRVRRYGGVGAIW